jgi:tetratricopeptide (TPR) repeat protein
LGGTLLDAAATAGVPAEERRLREEGIEHLRKAVEIYPGYGEAWLLLGNGYERSGSNRLAIEGYRRALSSWPNLAGAYTNLGSLLRREKDEVGSARALHGILSRDPENGLAWKELGLTYEDWGKPDSAVFAYEKAVAADSNYGEGLARLGTAYGHYRGNFQRAAELLSAAISKGYGEAWVYANLGVALASLGRFPQALQAFTDGLARHPGSPELERGLGITYRVIGDEGRAQEHEAKARAAEGRRP